MIGWKRRDGGLFFWWLLTNGRIRAQQIANRRPIWIAEHAKGARAGFLVTVPLRAPESDEYYIGQKEKNTQKEGKKKKKGKKEKKERTNKEKKKRKKKKGRKKSDGGGEDNWRTVSQAPPDPTNRSKFLFFFVLPLPLVRRG